MGQHCCSLANDKIKHPHIIKPVRKSKIDTSLSKSSMAATVSQLHCDNISKKKTLDQKKENIDSILPNKSVMASIYDMQNVEILPKNHDEGDGAKQQENKEANLESLFFERLPRPSVRDFDYQQDLNKPKINVLEIYKRDENGRWKKDLNMKDLFRAEEELNKINYTWKLNKRDSLGRNDREILEEMAP